MFSAIYVGYVVVILSQYYRSYLSKQSQKNMFYEIFFIRVVIKETMVNQMPNLIQNIKNLQI